MPVWNAANIDILDFNQLNTLRGRNVNAVDIRVDKKWFFEQWSLNLYVDVENITGNAVGLPVLILDRPVDDAGRPIGPGIIVNPEAPASQQRYLLKEIDSALGTPIPSIGIMIEW